MSCGKSSTQRLGMWEVSEPLPGSLSGAQPWRRGADPAWVGAWRVDPAWVGASRMDPAWLEGRQVDAARIEG